MSAVESDDVYAPLVELRRAGQPVPEVLVAETAARLGRSPVTVRRHLAAVAPVVRAADWFEWTPALQEELDSRHGGNVAGLHGALVERGVPVPPLPSFRRFARGYHSPGEVRRRELRRAAFRVQRRIDGLAVKLTVASRELSDIEGALRRLDDDE